MNATAAPAAVRQAGAVVLVQGRELVVRAPSSTPESVVLELLRHKKEVIELIAAKDREWVAADWAAFYSERAIAASNDAGKAPHEADRIAFECCVVRWLQMHPAPSKPGRCAGCGATERHGEVLLPFGVNGKHAWLHPQCHGPWYERRRGEAVSVLATMCITGPDRADGNLAA
jgi:hypothetical protein